MPRGEILVSKELIEILSAKFLWIIDGLRINIKKIYVVVCIWYLTKIPLIINITYGINYNKMKQRKQLKYKLVP